MVLLDSDILIDYLRRYPPALAFFKDLDLKEAAISTITHLELIRGCKKKINAQTVDKLVKNFITIDISPAISKKSVKIYRHFKWHTHLEIGDAFIAATAITSKAILLTRNLKHFQTLEGLKLVKPY